MSDIEKFPLTSMNITEEQKQKLKQLFPEVLTEGDKVDWDKLRLTLGETVDVGKERFGMSWPGKADCFKIIQQPSLATLLPARDESVNFDSTENLFIEGDNLEVLKLLQKSYLGKIKMIYIDPPFNTGNDFIYPDDYTETIETYLAYTGQIDDEGRRFGTNTDTEGRYHSKWMNMMFPRLFLAKSLLKDNGVILVSINDKEESNLKSLMNDVFGEENFIANLIWDKGHSAQAGIFKVYHEYILVYARDGELVKTPTSLDNNLFEAGAMKRESKRHPMQEFTFPAGVRFAAQNGTELSGNWGETEKIELVEGRMICENGVTKYPITLRAAFTQRNQMHQYFYGDKESLIDSRGQKIVEFYFSSSGKIKIVKQRGVYTPETTLTKYGTQAQASTELATLFELNDTPIENPKPWKMIHDFINWFTNDEDIVLDFFAGSCPTAHALLELTSKSDSKLSFICVQLPHYIQERNIAFQAGYKTIADVGKERIRRVVKKIGIEKNQNADMFAEDKPQSDLGFKVFRLASSNFSTWNVNVDKTAEAIGKQLELHIRHISESADQEAILFELLLKSGFELTTKIEKLEIEGKTVYGIGGNALYICLAKNLTLELFKELVKRKPVRIICLDEGFQNNDQLKTNVVQTIKMATKEGEEKIVFRTV